MAKQNRETLKNFFSDGALPTAGQFRELIDSTLNMKDEGFSKSEDHGFEVSTLGQSTSLISFYRDSRPLVPLWSIRLDEDGGDTLTFNSPPAEARLQEGEATDVQPVLTLGANGYVGVNTSSPECMLDVDGSMRCAIRLGTVPPRRLAASEAAGEQEQSLVDASEPVLADGKWHNITDALTGCQALEVVAGVGKKDTGRYALLHAIALNTYNPKKWLFNFFGWKNRIRCSQSFYRSRSDKLALRWAGTERRYFLQIRSNSDYGIGKQDQPVRINYHITNLWDDPRMSNSWNVPAGKG